MMPNERDREIVSYESDITFLRDYKQHGNVVLKKYKRDSDCVRWLNSHLRQYYPSAAAMPVAQHEFLGLELLCEYNLAPRPLELGEDYIILEEYGTELNSHSRKLHRQAEVILKVLKRLGFRHNDLLMRNIVINREGRMKLIDLTLAEFGGIEIIKHLPNPNWAYPGDERILSYFTEEETAMPQPDDELRQVAKHVYAYHNLGAGLFPEGEEKTPHGAGERYNFDRMYFMVSNYDFFDKNVIDIGCNSGWFCFQAKLLGAKNTVGIDYSQTGIMGTAVEYSKKLEQRFQLGMKFYNQDLEYLDMQALLRENTIPAFDAALVLSVMHHIQGKRALFEKLYDHVNDVIFYEDSEFWNELYDYQGGRIAVKGEGHRFGWNEDMSWQQRMMPIATIADKIIGTYMNSWRRKELLLDRFAKIQVLGLSEKRRPVLALWKPGC